MGSDMGQQMDETLPEYQAMNSPGPVPVPIHAVGFATQLSPQPIWRVLIEELSPDPYQLHLRREGII